LRWGLVNFLLRLTLNCDLAILLLGLYPILLWVVEEEEYFLFVLVRGRMIFF
jgi:hypothetical protein